MPLFLQDCHRWQAIASQVEAAPGITPRPSAVCRDHHALSIETLGEAFYGPSRRAYAGPYAEGGHPAFVPLYHGHVAWKP